MHPPGITPWPDRSRKASPSRGKRDSGVPDTSPSMGDRWWNPDPASFERGGKLLHTFGNSDDGGSDHLPPARRSLPVREPKGGLGLKSVSRRGASSRRSGNIRNRGQTRARDRDHFISKRGRKSIPVHSAWPHRVPGKTRKPDQGTGSPLAHESGWSHRRGRDLAPARPEIPLSLPADAHRPSTPLYTRGWERVSFQPGTVK